MKTVVPGESAWFGAYADPVIEGVTAGKGGERDCTGNCSNKIVPMRRTRVYTENWVGLKDLDERNALVFESAWREKSLLTPQLARAHTWLSTPNAWR